MKPMLAEDFVETKVKYPCIIQPKVDGVRGINFEGVLTGRSLKLHRNKYVTELLSQPFLAGFDGELWVGTNICDPDLCRKTSSVLSTITSEPNFFFWEIFDCVSPDVVEKPYIERYEEAYKRIVWLKENYGSHPAVQVINLIPCQIANNESDLLYWETVWLDAGYEGVIIRDPQGRYKQGRSTVKEGGLLRIKRFVEEEAVIVGFSEGQTNGNEAQTNELGKTFRTSHQEHMIPNGQIGSLQCVAQKDILVAGKILVKAGEEITISPGSLTQEERIFYFQNPAELIGKIGKFKFFPKGVKDKPRFPNFVCFRDSSDM